MAYLLATDGRDDASSGERQEMRHVSLSVRLLGAYHDGYIDLHYPQVFAYTLSVVNGETGHQDDTLP